MLEKLHFCSKVYILVFFFFLNTNTLFYDSRNYSISNFAVNLGIYQVKLTLLATLKVVIKIILNIVFYGIADQKEKKKTGQ
jgi:hypothetical protein